MSSSPTSAFLENYDSLDVIGNGSFGIIRKVRRKTDGLMFARKELNFERMTERDRKQIVAEVNILKELHHDHIVRYHDRYVDRDAGILYILMEYCGGGDLSTVIKHAARSGRPIPEDTIWGYFFQILHALQHCHHPNGHGRSNSGNGTGTYDAVGQQTGGGRRPQILHRDLKPDNVFLDEENKVKLGDFGLSKALPQASFANTYVGTPYYMSPELMQEKAYDSKSDIWSLGCLIYELCALKPPFHEAKTHSELSIFIRNGRIPPLPRGYSQALTSVIRSMLNLNPAMRPSAAQLLQHERLELVSKVQETEKMLAVVKSHRATVASKEREVLNRENALLETQNHLQTILAEKDNQIASLQQHLAHLQQQSASSSYSHAEVQSAVKAAVSARESELRTLVMQREAEVARAIALREEEIMEAVRARETEVDAACAAREAEIGAAFEARLLEVEGHWNQIEERIKWVMEKEAELVRREEQIAKKEEDVRRREEGVERDEARLEELKRGIENERESGGKKVPTTKGRKEKNPLEEVKNVLQSQASSTAPSQQQRTRRMPVPVPVPSAQSSQSSSQSSQSSSSHTQTQATPKPFSTQPAAQLSHTALVTPAAARAPLSSWAPASAMKGVVLTSTGEVLATPAPSDLARRLAAVAAANAHHQLQQQTPMNTNIKMAALATPRPSPVELVALFEKSPRVGLNFGKIFDFEEGASGNKGKEAEKERGSGGHEEEEEEELPPSPSVRTYKERSGMGRSQMRKGEEKDRGRERDREDAVVSETSSGSSGSAQVAAPPPTRIRRPSIRTSGRSANGESQGSSSQREREHANANTQQLQAQKPLPLPHPHLHPSKSNPSLRTAAAAAAAASGSTTTTTVKRNASPPEYDLADEENLPSPFLRRGERADKGMPLKSRPMSNPNFGVGSANVNAMAGSSGSQASTSTSTTSSTSISNPSSSVAAAAAPLSSESSAVAAVKPKRRPSSGLLLRAVAAANNAGRRHGLHSPVLMENGEGGQGVADGSGGSGSGVGGGEGSARPSLASARKASEDARKALLRP